MKKLFAIIFVCVLLVFVCSCTVVDKEKYTLIPMVMVNGELYLDTGHTDNEIKKCGTFDGEILSSVDPGEKPAKNDQSNFGKGYGYRYTSTKGVIEICMDSKWRIFATEEQRQKIQFENKSGEVVLKEPPELTVSRHNSTVVATRGTTSWMYKNSDGTFTGVESDSLHPLQAKEFMTPLYLRPSYYSRIDPHTAYLMWDIAPDKVYVHCWEEKYWGQYDAAGEVILVDILSVDIENGVHKDFMIDLKDGNYIYEVVAEWNSSESYGGTVHYGFYTQSVKLQLTDK